MGGASRNVDKKYSLVEFGDVSESEKLKNYFYNILARQDYSSGILRQKALQKGYEAEIVESVIRELQAIKYIDDFRYAENLVEIYLGAKGLQYIQQKLSLKKIPREIIQKIIEENAENNQPDENFIRRIRTRYKFYSPTELDPKTKNKVLQFIVRQGFSRPFEILKSMEDVD
jgi:SOS response regulatory protein OraA/RecX